MKTRVQISLLLPQAAAVEALRATLDPVQHALIPAHVTLCRDEEAESLDPVLVAARLAEAPPLELRFGAAQGFYEHGILLPCIAGEDAFRRLREHLLGRTGVAPLSPHITLAHPRNPKAPGNDLALALALETPLLCRFTHAQRIEQSGNAPWRVTQSFPLCSPPSTDT